ncbi:MAG: hypothetical protein QME94_12035 [Anaerolineae bacterium]|nr:hypothetical protein [Anaerolineae bacterium]
MMTEQRRYEKDEKAEEKQSEKQEEKGRGEKWQRDPVSAIVWALILIWAGLVLLADSLGALGQLVALPAWSVILIGAGLILLFEAAFRLLAPAYRRPVGGIVVLAIILIAIGLSSAFGIFTILPLALVIIGLYLLLRGLIGRS